MDFELAKAILKSLKFDWFLQKIAVFAKNRAKMQENTVLYVAKVAQKREITQKVNCARGS